MTDRNRENFRSREWMMDIARRALQGEYDILLACRDLVEFGRLSYLHSNVVNVLTGVASEVDGMPLAEERMHWNDRALKLADAKLAIYREQVRSSVEEALKELLN